MRLAANVCIGGLWYGPSYAREGRAEAPAGVELDPGAYDVRAHWATADDAARVGLDWEQGPPEATNYAGPEVEDEPAGSGRAAAGGRKGR